MATLTTAHEPERLYTLTQLVKAGYGSKPTLCKHIHAGRIPAQKINGMYKVRESDLTYVSQAIHGSHPERSINASTAELAPVADILASYQLDDLSAMTSRLIQTWPKLSTDQREQLHSMFSAVA